jgi:hypothetical protein
VSTTGLCCFQGTIPERLKQEIVSTAMNDSHLLNRGDMGVNSSADRL